MTVLITLTIPLGGDVNNFSLFSNIGGYATTFETNVSAAALAAGYLSSLVPNGTTTIRVRSTGLCTNFVDVPVTLLPTPTTTTTTTPTTTSAPVQLIIENAISTGTGSTMNSLSDYTWTTFIPGDFPISQGLSIYKQHSGFTGNLTVTATVSVEARVEIIRNSDSVVLYCSGSAGTGAKSYVFTGITIPTVPVTIRLVEGASCP
jgi:hypothetical protein